MEQSSQNQDFWKKCSSCKKPIGFKQKYWVCNVSTCNRKRTGLVFCTVSCWDAHVPLMNHRDSWALEETAPSIETYNKDAFLREQTEQNAITHGVSAVSNQQTLTKTPLKSNEARLYENKTTMEDEMSEDQKTDVLVVASKLKNYIREKSGMNTSGAVMEVLSNRIRMMCDQAIESAKNDGRKTVMDRDFQ